MSVDTRTPRPPDPSGRPPGDTPTRDPSGFFDDEPVLSSVKVLSDPAAVVVTHASFRVELGAPASRPATVSGVSTAARPSSEAEGVERRGEPLTWGTNAADTGGTAPVPAALNGRTAEGREPVGATTQVLPRIVEGTVPSGIPDGPGGPATVVSPRAPRPPEMTQQHPQPLLHGVRPTRGAFDPFDSGEYDLRRDGHTGHGGGPPFDDARYEDAAYDNSPYENRGYDDSGYEQAGYDEEFEGIAAEAARRQAYYPGRRMNLGVVLLPMRIFLGFISIYAGMGKLCDPVYFDGGARGSMVTWLRSLDPWALASPLYELALAHPVGSGLTVAFLQIIVGVLTVCGLWQRVAASVGALLSAALLMTVSWSSGPAYEAPDIIYLAAWSPLVIAGAPVYSIDGRLATDAWRKLGPRADLWDLRRRVLRRGTVIATVVVGVALLAGSMLGGAVRSSQTAKMPEPGEPPTNQIPGSPLPKGPGDRTDSGRPTQGRTQGADGGSDSRRSGGPSASASPGTGREGDPSTPSQRETVQAPQQTVPGVRPPQQSTPGSQGSRGGGSSTGGGSGGSNSGGGGGGSSSGGGGSSSGGSGGGLGGLLG